MRWETDPTQSLIGDGLEPVRERIAFLAKLRIPVLILGESGTGKELTARGLAHLSGRPADRFIPVNAATLTDPLAESLLFGHARGAFTGATERREGLLEASQGGTLFLDEIADMSLAVQAKFLRVIEEDRYLPVGDTRSVPVDARFVFATSANLHELAAGKRFREDLLHRLLGSIIEIPPLRSRRGDVASLTDHFKALAVREFGLEPFTMSSGTIRLLERQPWPGNARQLRNFVSQAMQECPGQEVTTERARTILRRTLGQVATFERSAPSVRDILRATNAAGGNVSEAARRLGYCRQHLYRILKAAGRDRAGHSKTKVLAGQEVQPAV